MPGDRLSHALVSKCTELCCVAFLLAAVSGSASVESRASEPESRRNQRHASITKVGVEQRAATHDRPNAAAGERMDVGGVIDTGQPGLFCMESDCDGVGFTGGDSCDDAAKFDLDVGDLQLVCGDNTPAGGQDEECGALAPDPVWWESFTIDQCADVLIDYCCTEPIPSPFYIVLSGNCPNCGLIFPTTGDACVSDDDCADRPFSHCNANGAGVFACRDFGYDDRGPRECVEGNPSVIYRGMGPGTYYYPIYSCDDPIACDPIAQLGAYQMHIEVLPPSTEPGGCCYPEAFGVEIVSVQSLRAHGAGELLLGLDLDVTSGIEPRRGGPNKLALELSEAMDGETVLPENVQIACTIGPAPTVTNTTLQGSRTVIVDFEGMVELDCCRFGLAGMQTFVGGNVIDTYNVRSLPGDVNFSGAVTGADPSLIKPHFGEVAGVDLTSPQWDYDLSGGVTGGDFALIKPRLGNVGSACPAAAGLNCFDVPCAIVCERAAGIYLGDGVLCGNGEICDQGACCFDDGRRCEMLTAVDCLVQGGDFAGPGRDCDPDCVCEPDGGGADACAELGDAVVIPLDGTVIKFAGDTTFANDIDCPLLDPDLTWWEKIEIEECADLLVDFCCTDPLLNVIYQVIYGDCPCDDDIVVGNAQFGFVCEDGNADVEFFAIGAGTYYYPVHACIDDEDCGLAISRLGPYQVHMRAEPADLQACCLPDSQECQMLCWRECSAAGGVWLGEFSDCDPQNPCLTGSCCFGPNECQETDLDTCLVLGGRYAGGTTCDQGACITNDFCEDAVLIECNSLTNAPNQYATTTADEPGLGCHNAGAGTQGIGNVWFKFVATHESARLHTCESEEPADDSTLAVYDIGDVENPCGSLIEIGCSESRTNCIPGGFGSDILVVDLTIGETYYIQLGSWTESTRGNYQLRIICPAFAGACCFEDNGQFVCQEGFGESECVAQGGRYGGNNSVCGPPGHPNEMNPLCGDGACCRSDDLNFCSLLSEDDCVNLCPDCQWQGDGVFCDDPGNPCAGACCTGDGDACMNTTEAGCLDDPPGGLGGAVWTRYLACNDPGIDCTNADQDICMQPDANCHLADQQGHGADGTLYVQSDRSALTQSRVADSFVPTATPISSECWWGVYANFQLQNPNCTRNDAFQVTYYAADGPSGLPGTVIRTSNIGATKALTGNVYVNAADNIIPEWEYRGDIHANADTAVGNCTWFEVTNDTGFQNCHWYWATSGDGDGLAVNDPNHINGYEVGEERDHDMAWCANVAIEADDCD